MFVQFNTGIGKSELTTGKYVQCYVRDCMRRLKHRVISAVAMVINKSVLLDDESHMQLALLLILTIT